MPGARDKPQAEVDSVRHLVELGYVDPDDIAAEKARLRGQLKAELDRAMTLVRQGRTTDAVALLDEISGRDPDWVAPRQRLAEIHYNAGNWAESETQLIGLAHRGVEDPRLVLISAGIALARRNLYAALEELQYARHVDPNLPSLHTLLGTALLRLGRWDEAEDAFRQAVQHCPTDARARDGLAAICLHHGEHEEAADWALRALEQDMRLFGAHYHLGLALARLNRPNEALQALETSTQIDPARPAPYRWLSRIAAVELDDQLRAAGYRERGREIVRRRRDLRERRLA